MPASPNWQPPEPSSDAAKFRAEQAAALAELRLQKMEWLKHPYTQTLIKELAQEEEHLTELIIGANNQLNTQKVCNLVSELKSKKALSAKLKDLMHTNAEQ